MHGGALYLGVYGLLALLALPAVALLALGSARKLVALALLVPLVLAGCVRYRRAIGRRPFQIFCALLFVLGHLAFTFTVGEHVPFVAWIAISLAHMAAAVSVHIAAYGEGGSQPTAELTPLSGVEGKTEVGGIVWLGFPITDENRAAVERALAATVFATGLTSALSLLRACHLRKATSVVQLMHQAWQSNSSSIELVVGVTFMLTCLHTVQLLVGIAARRSIE